ncbi:hypothetical protein KI809_00755 [Geobacter pelophilus]|uniref:C2H2-type domain-containing protein n=1 Tax=Geoanaerobacter pelophilus TaxID=60036 RepID=A0AAW4L6D5_9BACT|nr:hypothetical protein [Geoanaerobacter pelophilus]MBT0662816.1 hypothetical protein [Geoanaerobacter pelophilus]
MKKNSGNTVINETTEESCDIRIWSGECQHSSYQSIGEKYSCVTCGKIANINREVRHEGFPHVSGDYDNLS